MRYSMTDSKGREHVVDSTLSDESAAAIVEAKAKAGDAFCSRILKEYRGRWGWDDRWRAWGHIIAMREHAKRQQQQPAGVAGFHRLVGMMQSAFEAGIEFPKIRFDGLVLSRSGPRSKNPGVIFVMTDGSFFDRSTLGKITPDGLWHRVDRCTDEQEARVRALATDPGEVLAAYGRRTGVCSFCRRELSTKASLAVGYGPICADRFGLPWGDVPEDDSNNGE